MAVHVTGIPAYAVHGYRVACDLPLPVPAAPADGRPADITVCRGAPRPVPAEPLPGGELALLVDDGGRLRYTAARTGGGIVVRFAGACEFSADAALREVSWHADPRADEGLVGVLVAGTLLAVRLLLDGELALHASAVIPATLGGGAVAFVGASGMGKSTLAALACADGAALLTDDVLRVSDPGERPLAWPGAVECRLRDAAAPLADRYAAAPVRRTADGRTALAPPARATAAVPLDVVVIPRPRRGPERVSARRLPAAEALLRLVRFPRVVGWSDGRTLARQFHLLGDLAAGVPVVEATIPWGPPFPRGLAADVLAAASDAAGLSGTPAPAP